MNFLITGFEPFGNESVNPSWEAVKRLPDQIEEFNLLKVCLPVSFQRAVQALGRTIESHRPDVLLSVGQAGGRPEISVERIAVNLADGRNPDNDGCQFNEHQLYADAPVAYFSNLPVRQLVKSLHETGIPAVLSNSAGLFVCNAVFYSAMHLVHTKYPSLRAGFIHVPYLPCQVVDKPKQPSMATETVVRALMTIIKIVSGSSSPHTLS